jgi:serine/threonine-protein kinase
MPSEPTTVSYDPEERFHEAIASFEEALDAGQSPDPRDWLARYPDVAERLREYFADREGIERRGGTLLPPDAPDRWPTVTGYQIHELLGAGGMGVVYRASDPDLGRDLAVKVLREEHRERPEAVLRFIEEAQITGQLQHPGIPPVHERGRLADGRPFFAMKLIQGQTLAALLKARHDPSEDLPRFLAVLTAVCQAVAYAHSRGIIHRDLKPRNVMVGAFAEVQVMDWGLAKVRKAGGTPEPPLIGTGGAIRTVRTQVAGFSSHVGDVLGTYAYMAPEAARGEVDQLDERTDVFGLGGILCEILTGRGPFAGGDKEELSARARACDHAEAFAQLDACGGDAELARLAKACLGAERTARPRDAGEVAGALTVYLAEVQERLRRAEVEQAASEARAQEARATAVSERRARRLTMALAGAVLVLVAAAAGGGMVGVAPAGEGSAPAGRSGRGGPRLDPRGPAVPRPGEDCPAQRYRPVPQGAGGGV